MVIRNSKPAAIGFPAPMHMDISSAGTVWFSKTASADKTMAFITKANAPSAFDAYRNFFFDSGWNCDVASGEKAAGVSRKQRFFVNNCCRNKAVK